MIKLLIILFLSIILFGDEYDFDISNIEPKEYEYNGYLRIDDKFQKLDKSSDEYQNYIHTEALFNLLFFRENITLKASVMATYDYIKDNLSESEFPINELYGEVKINTNHSLLLGKKSLKWGKGYFFNPVSFLDRAKDPTQPTQVREGYYMLKYSYNKSYKSDLKNLSYDVIYLPSTESVNKDFNADSNNLAARLYLLYFDTDIDIIYHYSDTNKDKIGIDFSKNIETNFEIHGEYAKDIGADDSFLLGLRYLTNFDLTIISEYLNDKIDRAVTLVTQKEPFDILYFSIYAKNSTNLDDKSRQDKVGAGYSFKNNIDVDLSYNINSGDSQSEFGKKPISDFIWLQLNWKF